MHHNIGVSVICPDAVNTLMKHSVKILAVDKESGPIQKFIQRFEKHAISPERAAEIIIDAINKNRFLVITSTDIKVLYFLKRYCFPAYHLILLYISRLLNSMKIR
jgi:hypothetical protein